MIHHGDLFEVLPTLEADSFDACVTDPPYGIGFMGKEWDNFRRSRNAKDAGRDSVMGRLSRSAPASGAETDSTEFHVWCQLWAREVFRVLKPGAHLIAFGGTRTFHRLAAGIEDAGFEIRDCLSWLYGSGFPKSLDVSKAIDKRVGNPATPAAQKWQGWGTALKPAWEPIIVARKPLAGTVAANVLVYGTGALNIDGCRIGNEESAYGEKTVVGRWPANVCLDESAAAMLDEQSGERVSGGTPAVRYADKCRHTYGAFKGGESKYRIGASAGGASRFFYVAKPSTAEREAGLTGRNRHPTVKPVELMRWLVRLVTPPGGLVLDPFAGSGTTGMACAYEGMRFVGIEREAEYVAVAERRIASCLPLLAQEHTA